MKEYKLDDKLAYISGYKLVYKLADKLVCTSDNMSVCKLGNLAERK